MLQTGTRHASEKYQLAACILTNAMTMCTKGGTALNGNGTYLFVVVNALQVCVELLRETSLLEVTLSVVGQTLLVELPLKILKR